MKLLIATFLIIGAFCSSLRAQWVEGGRKQAQNVNGNGALYVYDGTMYLWNEQFHFSTSTDGGDTWQDPTDSIGGANPHVTILTGAGGRVYGGLNFGTGQGMVIYSSDKGVTWNLDTLGAPGHVLGWGGLPVVRNIFAWGHWVFVGWDGPNMYDIKTFDGPYKRNTFLAQGINNPSSMVAKGDTLFAAGAKISYTTDGGENWVTPANNGYSGYGAKMYLDGNRIYMFAYQAWQKPCMLYYTDDNAENWTEIDISAFTTHKGWGDAPYYPTAAFIKGEKIWVSVPIDHLNTQPNIFKSTDLGKTWSADTVGLPWGYVNGAYSFAYTDNGYLWVVPDYQEIYKQKIDAGIPSGPIITTAPVQVLPLDAEVIDGHDATIRWSTVPNATKYHLQVASDAQFTAMVIDDSTITDTSKVMTDLANDARFYWRVSAIGSDGLKGPFSTAHSFTMHISAGVKVSAPVQVQMTPNPAHDKITFMFGSKQVQSVQIVNMLGQVVRSTEITNGAHSISLGLGGLPSGSYTAIITTAKGKQAERFLVQ